MTIALVALSLSVLGLLVKLYAKDHAAAVDRAGFAKERREWVAERRELNQRIQAPETAVAQAVAETSPDGLLHVPIDDDQAFQTDRLERLSG